MHLPIIGLTQSSQSHHPRTLPDYLFDEVYRRIIRESGGVPIPINFSCIQNHSIHLDGILFRGGGDINPQLFGERIDALTAGIDDQRDELELALFERAILENIPFLGICRGLQLINVAQGGSLYQDLARKKPSGIPHDWHPSRRLLAHEIYLEPSSILREIGYPEHARVNSLHHQGINSLGARLCSIAHSPDGLIEAIQLSGHRFGLAVQWHPEWLIDQVSSRNLFRAFIHSCERNNQ
jgi:putative glutamine amidotransferase